MTAENFCYWLQGYFELTINNGAINFLNAYQIAEIKKHIELVKKSKINIINLIGEGSICGLSSFAPNKLNPMPLRTC